MGHDPTRGSGPEVLQKPAGRVELGQQVLEISSEPVRVESPAMFNLTGRVGSHRPDQSAGSDTTRKKALPITIKTRRVLQ